MKKVILNRLITILAALFISIGCSAQEGMLVRNIKTGKTWMYEKDSKLTYIRFNDEEYTRAALRALHDSTVVLGNDTVKLKDIAGIRKKNTAHKIARIVGLPLMLVGSILMGEGLAAIYSDPRSKGGSTLFLLGAGVFTVGYLPFHLSMKDRTVGFGGEWKLEICKQCLSAK